MESSSVFCETTSDYEEEERSAIQEMENSFATPPSPTSSKSADSKRSSATSGVESSSEMNDAETRDANDVEEEEEKCATSNKYEEVDIAKILHTRKRIHQTLNRPSALQSSIDHLPTVQQQQQHQQNEDNNKTLKKRTSKLAKYGTLSRRKTPVSAPIESASGSGGSGSRFSFAPPTSPDGSAAASSSSFGSRTGAVFNYNTVGRRRNKPRPNIALISSPIDLSSSRFDYPNLATAATEAANERWGIQQGQQGDPLSPPMSPVDSDEGKQAKRKKRWTSSIRRLVSIGSSSSSSSDRDRVKEEKKASIRLHDASLDLSFQSLDLSSSSSSATGRKLSESGSSYYLGHVTSTTTRHRAAIDRDLFTSSLEERIINETINNDSSASNPTPPSGLSRKKSFKKMFKSLKLSSSSGTSTLPRKKQRDKQ